MLYALDAATKYAISWTNWCISMSELHWMFCSKSCDTIADLLLWATWKRQWLKFRWLFQILAVGLLWNCVSKWPFQHHCSTPLCHDEKSGSCVIYITQRFHSTCIILGSHQKFSTIGQLFMDLDSIFSCMEVVNEVLPFAADWTNCNISPLLMSWPISQKKNFKKNPKGGPLEILQNFCKIYHI